MSETSLPDGTLTEHAHQLVDGLTALKVHVGMLRLQVQQGAVEAGELDAVSARSRDGWMPRACWHSVSAIGRPGFRRNGGADLALHGGPVARPALRVEAWCR